MEETKQEKVPTALGDYIVVAIEKEQEKITKAGLVLASTGETIATNTGDKLGTTHRNIVASIGPKVTLDINVGDEVICNPWNIQLFESGDKTYGAVPSSEVKAVL